MEVKNKFLYFSAINFTHREDIPWKSFQRKTFVITGSTGLIGSQLVRVLLSRNDQFGSSCKLILPVRNITKAQMMFGERPDIVYIQWELDSEVLALDSSADYFIHAACGTSSKAFLNNPASTISSIVNGAETTLRAAQRCDVDKYLFLSTMEVYGEVSRTAVETNLGSLDPMVVRNSYPEAKKLVECLCASYYSEFSLHTIVLRLAQTFGQGVSFDDERVFAEFGRHAAKGEDIILFSDGKKKNMYLSVNDAVSAILFGLAYGEPGNVYNVANEATYCSVEEMANMVIRTFGKQGTSVQHKTDKQREASFRKSSDLRMDCSKLNQLGWVPVDDLRSMYQSMMNCW